MSEQQVPYVDPSDITYLDTDIPGFRIPIRKTVLRLKPENTEGEAVSTKNYQLWLQDWMKNHPNRILSEWEEKAFRLWYALVHASVYGFIDVNEDDDPTDAPDFISVIVRFLDEEHAQLRAIVQALAEDDPYVYNDDNGKIECVFCCYSWGWAANEKHTKGHEPDCLITKARALVDGVTQE